MKNKQHYILYAKLRVFKNCEIAIILNGNTVTSIYTHTLTEFVDMYCCIIWNNMPQSKLNI